MAMRAEDGYGIIVFALLLRRVLRAVLIEDIEDLFAVFERENDVLGIPSRTVFLRLIAVVHLYAEFFDRLHELLFKMRGVTLVFAERIGNIRIRIADILLERIVAEIVGNVFRHLAQTVVLVPRKNHPRLFPLFEKGAVHEITRGDIAEISDMHGTGGRNARRTDVFFLVRLSADDLIRQLICPIHNAFSWSLNFLFCYYTTERARNQTERRGNVRFAE